MTYQNRQTMRGDFVVTAVIHYIEFPEDVKMVFHGMTKQKNNGDFLIVIDSMLAQSEQIRTKEHELAHILLDHFYADDRSIQDLEKEADDFAFMRSGLKPEKTLN